MADAQHKRPWSSASRGHYRSTTVVATIVFAPAAHGRQGFLWPQARQGGRPVASPVASASACVHGGDMNVLDTLLIASELLRHCPADGGHDASADLIDELITIATKALAPYAPLCPRARPLRRPRPGAFAVYLEPWHADIFEFLDLRKNHGKIYLIHLKSTLSYRCLYKS
ncbi:Ribonucleotide reductase 1 isoform 2 [Hordeum vulgare]|nr:Ribonucleotide reductase 1 isoform 2 [Hordeum vulgare]